MTKKAVEYEYLKNAPYKVLLDKRLKSIDVRVFMVHWQYANIRRQKDGISTLQTIGDTQHSLTRLLDITDSTAKRSIKRLRELGYLQRVRNQNMNVAGYVVNPVPKSERWDSINHKRGLTVCEDDTNNAYRVKKLIRQTLVKGQKCPNRSVKKEPTL